MKESERLYFYYNPQRELEKYVVGGWEEHKHLTIRIWHDKKEFDLHISDETYPEGHKKRGKALFKMTFEEFNALNVELDCFDSSKLLRYFKTTLSPSKLIRTNSYIQLLPKDENSINRIFKIQSNKRRGKMRRNLQPKDFEDFLMWPEEIAKHDTGAFVVYRMKRGKHILNGYAYRYPAHMGTNRFIFVSKKEMNALQKEIMLFFYTTFQKVKFKDRRIIFLFKRLLKQRLPHLKGI